MPPNPDKTRRILSTALEVASHAPKKSSRLAHGRLVLCGGGPSPWFDLLADTIAELRESGELDLPTALEVLGVPEGTTLDDLFDG